MLYCARNSLESEEKRGDLHTKGGMRVRKGRTCASASWHGSPTRTRSRGGRVDARLGLHPAHAFHPSSMTPQSWPTQRARRDHPGQAPAVAAARGLPARPSAAPPLRGGVRPARAGGPQRGPGSVDWPRARVGRRRLKRGASRAVCSCKCFCRGSSANYYP